MLGELETLARMARDGSKVRLPLLDREIPLVADIWAKPELGTGCVKITPAHDPNDYEVGLRQKLPMINILNFDGTLNENAGPYKGLTIPKAGRPLWPIWRRRASLPRPRIAKSSWPIATARRRPSSRCWPISGS